MKLQNLLLLTLISFFYNLSFSQDLQWLEHINNVDDDLDVHSMTLSSSGDIFIGGSYDDQSASAQEVFFGSIQATSVNEQNGFLAKYNASGVQQWQIAIGSPHSTTGYSPLAMVEDAGFLYVTGSFQYSSSPGMDFDPGAGTNYSMSTGAADFFVSKYNSSTGNLVWNYTGSGTAGSDLPSGIDVDASGNIYVTGKLKNGFTAASLDIKSGTAPSSSSTANKTHLYLVKYDANCNFQWRVNVLNSSNISGGSLVVDKINGYVYMAGGVGKTSSSLNPSFSGNTLNVNTNDDGFIAKYDLNGNFQWVKNVYEGTSANWIHSIDVDDAGNIYTSGVLQGSADFDPAGTRNLSSVGSYDACFAKYTPAGSHVWSYGIGSTSFGEGGYSIDVTPSGDIAIGGAMYGAADYNPEGSGGAIMKGANGSRYAYIGKYDTDFKYEFCHAIGNTTITTGFNYTKVVAINENEGTCGVIYAFGYIAKNISEDFDPDNAGGDYTSTGTKENGFLLQYDLCPIVLPVELSSFSNFCLDGQEYFQWSTLSESRVDYFQLEYSYDGIVFHPSTILDAVGNSTTQNDYEIYIENTEQSQRYYRLKIVDENSEVNYSEVISGYRCVNSSELISTVFQSNETLHIYANSPLKVKVFNQLGQVIYTSENQFNVKMTVNTSNISKGVYFIIAEDKFGKQESKKIILID